MDLIIESFKRLYHSGQINDATLNLLLQKNYIAESDMKYIKQEEGDK